MYRKYVTPLSKRMIQKLIQLYTTDPSNQSAFHDFDYYIGQLYKKGIVQIKKQLENGSFVIFISLTEAGKELLKKTESLLEPAV